MISVRTYRSQIPINEKKNYSYLFPFEASTIETPMIVSHHPLEMNQHLPSPKHAEPFHTIPISFQELILTLSSQHRAQLRNTKQSNDTDLLDGEDGSAGLEQRGGERAGSRADLENDVTLLHPGRRHQLLVHLGAEHVVLRGDESRVGTW